LRHTAQKGHVLLAHLQLDAHEVFALRTPRVEFVRDFSLEATDTMLPGGDPVAGTLAKSGPDFIAKLRRLYADVPGPEALGAR
jgi:hypothetical protein